MYFTYQPAPHCWCIAARFLTVVLCLQVDDKLRVEGHANWYALGDCNNLPETNLGYQARMQALEVVKSLQSVHEHGAEDAVLTTHKPWTGVRVSHYITGCKYVLGWT